MAGDRAYSILDGTTVTRANYPQKCFDAGMWPAVIYTKEDMDAAVEVCQTSCWIGTVGTVGNNYLEHNGMHGCRSPLYAYNRVLCDISVEILRPRNFSAVTLAWVPF